MGSRIVDVTVSTLIVVLVIYLMKWAFVKNMEVPYLTDVLKAV